VGRDECGDEEDSGGPMESDEFSLISIEWKIKRRESRLFT